MRLSAPLSELAGGRASSSSTARPSQRCCWRSSASIPDVKGWILDEHGAIREHVNVFVNKEYGQEDTAVAAERPPPRHPRDLRRIGTMTQLLVGTKKGLFVLEGAAGWAVRGDVARVRGRAGRVRDARLANRPLLRGRHVRVLRAQALLHRRPRGRVAAGGGHRAPRGRGEAARAAVGDRRRARRTGSCTQAARRGPLREPRRRRDLAAQQGFWEQPTRPDWSPGAGGMCMHSIATWPGDPKRIALAISAVGVWLTDDGGETWRHGNKGLYPALHARGGARGDDRPLRPQHAPRAEAPERLFMQFHGGVYRSDDAGESWTSIADGLPVRLRLPDGARPRRP